jgi:Sec-independent protein secretion pathway component TatC
VKAFAEVPTWGVAAALPIVLAVAWVFGAVARRLLRGRARLGVATSMVISILATAVGLAVAGL